MLERYKVFIIINSQLLNSPIIVQFKESLKQASIENDKDDQFRDMVLIV